jgi:hypothetical protein
MRAPMAPPASLPMVATPTISSIAPTLAPVKALAVVPSPASAKNSGISTTMEIGSMRSVSEFSKRSSRGRQAPNRKAPNTACRCSHSVASAHTSRPIISEAIMVVEGSPLGARVRSSHAKAGFMPKNSTASSTTTPAVVLSRPV